uniref:Uncharacterized protein n=1 Tax=Myoviridae sp. ctMYT7 TaxID=2825087 RepID=A0A8S5Q381_9CAUD|nr:MAG TPA: hypothetical protein [Myoviridae sp. ctMYT7]
MQCTASAKVKTVHFISQSRNSKEFLVKFRTQINM